MADIYTKISNYHIQFETIHPFEDGNGRTCRLLINYELLKNNLPPIVISKEDRVKYFEYLRIKDCKGLAQWIQELSKSEKERMKKFATIYDPFSSYTKNANLKLFLNSRFLIFIN